MPATKILVVDDRVLYRKILRDVVDQLPGAVTIGTAVHGKNALFQVDRLHPDLVLLDVEMPVMDGLTTLKHLRKRHPGIAVVMVSGTSKSAADLTMQALEQGAVDFIEKPAGSDPKDSRRRLAAALTPVLALVRQQLEPVAPTPAAPVAPTPAAPVAPPEPKASAPVSLASRVLHAADKKETVSRKPTVALVRAKAAPVIVAETLKREDVPEKFSVVAIGTSTGGPAALGKLVPMLPANLPIPVLIVQHMPPGFTRSLAAQLDARSGLRVKEAKEDDPVVAGTIFIAPGGRHMEVVKRKGRMSIHLQDEAQVRNCRPSVDVLFESLASTADLPVLSVVMTGMGDDGTTGVAKLASRGSYNLTQDAQSCVVYGMPRVVAERGLSHEVLPLDKIANRIKDLAGRSGGE